MKKYKYIFTDLDGTLYRIFPDPFTVLYKQSVCDFFNEKGFDGKTESEILIKAFAVMRQNENHLLIKDAFYNFILPQSKIDRQTWENLLNEYYNSPYYQVCKSVASKSELMPQIINKLKQKGYPIFLTTNPVFYKIALLKRLEWAEIDKNLFEEVTSFENYVNAKPHKEYFMEVCKKFNLNPSEILMLGNDTTDDTACEEIGIDCYIITDNLINISNEPIKTKYFGTSNDLMKFVDENL